MDSHDSLRTAALCDAGRAANAWLSELHARAAEMELFRPFSEAVETFTSLVSPRVEYWRARPRGELIARIAQWCEELEREVACASAAEDRSALVRHWCWGALSTVPLVRSLAPEAGIELSRLERSLGAAERRIQEIERGAKPGIHWTGRTECSESFVARRGKYISTNTYRVEGTAGRPPRVVELVEARQLGEPATLTLCIPLAVGCPNACAMCDFGLYNGGPLDPDQILRLIELNLEMNREIPVRFDESRSVLYFLGAGDAVLYPDMGELIRRVDARFPSFWKVFSTIGNDVRGGLARLVDSCATSPRTGLQVSLCSLDEGRREVMVGTRRTVSVDECVAELERFRVLSGRKGFISLFLFEDEAGEPTRFLERVQRHVPSQVHITLTVLQAATRPLPWRGASLDECRQMASRLESLGYEVSVSTNDEDPEQQASCGRSDVLHENRGYWKRAARDVGRAG